MRGPVRVVRTGHVQSVLHATEAIAERPLFIRHQLLSEFEDVLCWTLAEYVGDCPESRAAEMLSEAVWESGVLSHLGGGSLHDSTDPVWRVRPGVPPLERRSGGCSVGVRSDRGSFGSL